MIAGLALTERRRSRTYQPMGYIGLPVLKTGWATGPLPPQGAQSMASVRPTPPYSGSASASTPSLARRRMRSRVSSIRSRSSAVSSSATDGSGSGGS